MKFKQINENQLKSVYPNKITDKLEKMSKQEKENYLLKYFSYRKLFTEYMIKKLDLKKYDDELAESKLNFKPNSEKDMDIYQYFSSEELKYFYIRNNIYIERLNEEETKFLTNKIDDNCELDLETEKFIEDTYEKVIFEDVLGNGELCEINYGPDGISFMAGNDAIVVGVRYEEFNTNGLNDKEWSELHYNQLLFLGKTIDKINVSVLDMFKVPVNIIKYNEFSVEKM